MTRAIVLCAVLTALAAVACGGSADKQQPAASSPSAAATPTIAPLPGAAPGNPACPATGLWARCSVMYRLGRSGIIPRLDSTATVEEKTLHASESFVVKIGANASLEVFLYPDSAARKADEAKLDRKQFVSAGATQTINRERTLIENANLIGLLTSLNDRLRERVSDALTAGAPQPAQPVTVKP